MKRTLITLMAGMLLIPATFVAQSGYGQASGQAKTGDEKKATASSTTSTETKTAEAKTAKKGKKASKKGKKESAEKKTS